MKDCKTRQKYVSKWLRMEFFPNGDYGIHFLLGFMYFEFTKDNQLKYSIESKQFRKGKVVMIQISIGEGLKITLSGMNHTRKYLPLSKG